MNSFTYILFGATGDLARTQIFSAIYQLIKKNLLPGKINIIAIGRTNYDNDSFREYFLESLSRQKQKLSKKLLSQIVKNIFYFKGNINNPSFYHNLEDFLKQLETQGINCSNRIFHLAILPNLYKKIIENLGQSNLCKAKDTFTRIMIEKPFGKDKKSAKELDKVLYQYFNENQIYRLDHYLAKETVLNILAFRFGNGLFEPIWNHHFIDHIQIQIMEDFGIKNRGIFYTETGAIRDIVQNHILQLLSVITMDRPQKLDQAHIRSLRQKLIYSIKPYLSENKIKDSVVVGQYQDFKSEISETSDHNTETFAALKLEIDDPRWKKVPIYIRTGKKTKRKISEINIIFKKPPFKLFPEHNQESLPPSVLSIRIAPNEGIVLSFAAKIPGPEMKLQSQKMQFCYSTENSLLEPYAKLIFDALAGDQTLFNLSQDVRAAWRFIDPITEYLEKNRIKPILYLNNSWGPEQANKLIEKDGRHWIDPEYAFCTQK